MDYTIEPKLKQLDSKIQNTESRLLEEFNKKEASMLNSVHTIKSSIYSDLDNQSREFREIKSKLTEEFKQINSEFTKEFKQIKSDFSQEYKRFELDVREHLDSQDQQNNQRDNQIYNALTSLDQKIKRMHFDIIDNEDNVAVTYVNQDGKIEYGAIKKFIPDGKSLVSNKGIVSWNYSLNPLDFEVDVKNKISLKPIKHLELSNGKKLSVDRINNDLENATYNIGSLTYKIDSIVKKLNSVNGYVASNNFGTDKPSQEQLTSFVLNCLSTSKNEVTKDLIPNGTKIKNTYDNHIWIINRISVDGLTTIKWEDFGSDNICIASNDGIHGLVTGSQEKFRGYIDINGVISINSLEEELTSIMSAVFELTTTVNELKEKISAMENINK